MSLPPICAGIWARPGSAHSRQLSCTDTLRGAILQVSITWNGPCVGDDVPAFTGLQSNGFGSMVRSAVDGCPEISKLQKRFSSFWVSPGAKATFAQLSDPPDLGRRRRLRLPETDVPMCVTWVVKCRTASKQHCSSWFFRNISAQRKRLCISASMPPRFAGKDLYRPHS